MQKKIWIFHLSQQEFLFWTIGWPWRSNFEVKQYWNIMRSIKFMVCTFHFNFNLYSTFHSTPGKVITWYASLTLSLTSIPPQGHLVQPHTLHIQNLWWEKRWMGVQDCGNHGREFELQVHLTVWVNLFWNVSKWCNRLDIQPPPNGELWGENINGSFNGLVGQLSQELYFVNFGYSLYLFLGWNVTKRRLWHRLGRPLHHPWQSQAASLKTTSKEWRMLSMSLWLSVINPQCHDSMSQFVKSLCVYNSSAVVWRR